MATNTTQKQAAKQFVQDWSEKGYEKGETSRFWIALLQNVYGIQDATKFMEFELPVKTILKEKGSDYIDGYIPSTKVLIEQKGSKVDLSEKRKQSDGSELTPYQQARRYAAGLPVSMMPRWIVACNFRTFEVHDMERPNDPPEVIELKDLEKEYHRLSFLVDDTNVHLKKELEVSIQAGEIVGVLYDKILAQYKDPENPETQKALNKLCVRLVFCLYAEDAGIFGTKNMFHDYMSQFPTVEFREKLIKLFRILDQKPEDRDPYEDEALLAFPYVNGGMFAGDIEIPRITEEIRTLILQRASDDFDWSQISPTIFGAVFESTLNPETRRAGGMHYTSIENIHKVIDPLFLDELKAELSNVKTTPVVKTRKERAFAFQDKISKLKFFDPACGSGNFLTESYTCLRRLENEALWVIYGGDRIMGEMVNPIKVSIDQFYGIEINDFACSVAQTALWIAESQMMQKTDEIVGFNLDPLPLKTYTNIHEGNALRMDWNDVVPAFELNYIMGNPPFIGYAVQSLSQKEDMKSIFTDDNGKPFPFAGKIDYVAAWYRKGVEYMKDNTRIHGAFVSTNSVTQGEQVAFIWKDLVENRGMQFDFAYRTFQWDSEAYMKAHVYCVIIGFSLDRNSNKAKYIFDPEKKKANNINAYLYDAPNVYVESRVKPICSIPAMVYGNKPVEGGFLILTEDERVEIIEKYPFIEPYIHLFLGAEEYIYNKKRYCFWLVNANPADIRRCPPLVERIEQVRKMRLASKKEATQKLAITPTLFAEIRQPKDYFMVIPEVSGESRTYVPIGFLEPNIICSNKIQFVPLATKYHFGVVTSIVNMAWLRVVCGRLGMSYDYSAKIVYNNLPWPSPTEAQKKKIESTAQMILDARALFPENSFADIYDDLAMPPELRRAHQANDVAVMEAYGFPKNATESETVARLFKMYLELTK
jgi:hypothetical protein